MVQYKLTYFPVRGAGETTRQIFALAGQTFEDVRVPMDEWPQHKAKMPFGQMPVLEVDGKQLPQTGAMNRYLARQFGFAGKNAWDEAIVDALADQWKDFLSEIKPYFMVFAGFAQGDLAQLEKDVYLPATKKHFAFITNYLKKNPSGFLVGDSVTWVDLMVAEYIASNATKSALEGFPELVAHKDKIHAIPQIKKWRETRPETPF